MTENPKKAVKNIVENPTALNGLAKAAGPSSRFKVSYNNQNNDTKPLSKKAKRRLRQKMKKRQEGPKINMDELEKEMKILKGMNRLKSDLVTGDKKQAILSNIITNTGKLR